MTVLHESASANFEIVGLAAKDPTDCRLRGHVRIQFSEKCRQPRAKVQEFRGGRSDISFLF